MQIGNEFASVEALWSQFETVMASDGGDGSAPAAEVDRNQDGAGGGEAEGGGDKNP